MYLFGDTGTQKESKPEVEQAAHGNICAVQYLAELVRETLLIVWRKPIQRQLCKETRTLYVNASMPRIVIILLADPPMGWAIELPHNFR